MWKLGGGILHARLLVRQFLLGYLENKFIHFVGNKK
jgi:hypothetical protein